MSVRFLAVVLLCLPALSAQSRGLDIGLGNEAAHISYLMESDSQIGIGGTDFAAGVFFNEDDDIVGNLNVLVTGNSLGQNRSLQLGAGGKLYAGRLDVSFDGDGDKDAVASIAIGGKVAYIFPARTPMSLSVEGYWAPEVTSFGDNTDFTEFNLRFELEVAPTTRFFVGYRNMETEIENSGVDYELDDSAHVGVRFAF